MFIFTLSWGPFAHIFFVFYGRHLRVEITLNYQTKNDFSPANFNTYKK